YLRFKRHQVEEFKKKFNAARSIQPREYSFKDRLSDFFYFNDFYILSFIIIFLLLFIILH
ncbi:MAG: hypothetical protein PHN57_07925, partial [Candidatus Omnitrophica bacterium]|nr:hypothetical protein [Candidatus Omnitrophota bacterium]